MSLLYEIHPFQKDAPMSNAEATKIMTDVATKRKPHSRAAIQDALFQLEGIAAVARHQATAAPAPAPAATEI